MKWSLIMTQTYKGQLQTSVSKFYIFFNTKYNAKFATQVFLSRQVF